MHPGDPRWWRAAHLAVKAGGATLDDLQDVQLASEERLNRGRDPQAAAGCQLLCGIQHSVTHQYSLACL